VAAFSLLPGGLGHVEVAQARELDHLGGRGHADHGVALLASRLQRGQDGQEVVFHEEHAGHDDVGAGDVFNAAFDGGVVASVFGRGVQGEREARDLVFQRALCALDGTGQVRVHGDHHQPHGQLAARRQRFSAHSELWRHTASPR